jgi:hypothetical protein
MCWMRLFKKACTAVVMVITVGVAFAPLLVPMAVAAADVDPMRLNTTLNEAAIENLDVRSMRVTAEMQHPGLGRWKYWRMVAFHSQTGEVLACYRKQTEQCRQFQSYAQYTTFRVAQFNAAEHGKFR